ncbi:MAG: O-antigen ligase family protein, partial [Solirubrobacterales bacterium]|nr:O-antigen ligase family protein [Solirubrobacterales bacterium]
MAGLVGAAGLCLVAFLASGGVDLAPNTWVQIGLLGLGAATTIAAVLVGGRGRAWGGVTLLLFAALAALTYASIAWSVQPANSWLEANRTLSYLAVFATGLLLARFAPETWRALIGGVAVATTVVCGYALLVKVFPGTFDPGDPLGRLQAPFGYWNAVGLMGALGLGPCLWAGSRREGSVALRALTVPAIAVLVPAVLLAYSRGAILAALIGLAVWFGLAPLRLRSALILGLGALGGGVITAWGLARRGISADAVGQAARTSAGHSFGIVIVVVLVLSAAGGVAAVLALDRIRLPARIRRAVATALLVGVALIPVAGVAALAASSRGLTGQVSHIWSNLTNPNGVVNDQPGRLVNLSNSRPHYWSQAITLGEQHLLAGVGALGFATAQPSSASPIWNAQHAHAVHAHGYLAETFADFGLIGLVLSLGLLTAWGLAAARTLELHWPRRHVEGRSPPSDAEARERRASPIETERAGLVALLAVVVTFGVHSLIDWTWFIPGTAVPARACAGWLAGRGPVSARIGRLPQRRRLSRAPTAAIAVIGTAVVTLVAVWVIVQPLRSADAYSAAYSAAFSDNARVALTDAQSAASEDPVSVDPLFLLSLLYSDQGNSATARRELVQAESRQPANPETWQEL